MRKSLDVLGWWLNMALTTKVELAKFYFLIYENSYHKTVITHFLGIWNYLKYESLKTIYSHTHFLGIWNYLKYESLKNNILTYSLSIFDFNFGTHKDLSTLKSDIHLGLAASVNYHFFG